MALTETMPTRYRHADLVKFADAPLSAAGLEQDRARAVAGILFEGDLMGHTAHGLVLRAMEPAMARAAVQGTCSVVFRRSPHIACLAAYLKRATDQGLPMLFTCSDPNAEGVAPFGGLDAVFTSNPILAGIPTGDIPVLVDVSTSGPPTAWPAACTRRAGSSRPNG